MDSLRATETPYPLRLRAYQARADIVSGALRGEALRTLLLSTPARERDSWTDEILGMEAPPDDAPNLPRGCVPYWPCGVDEILAMVRDVPIRPNDVLVDLGSGLGRVAILVHLLTGARAGGIEIQEHLVRRARALSAALALPDVSFVHGDAAESTFDGSVFFLYAPFNGRMLSAVLDRLEGIAATRPIVLCTVGLELCGMGWLRPRRTANLSLFVYDSQ